MAMSSSQDAPTAQRSYRGRVDCPWRVDEWSGRLRTIVAQYPPYRPVHRMTRAGMPVGSPGSGDDPSRARERSRDSMDVPRARIPTALAILIGALLGWVLASFRPAPLQAGAGDRSGEAIVTTGPVLIRFD